MVSSFGNLSKNAVMTARYFEYKDIYKKTPYILTVKLATISKVKDATFYLNFYSIKKEGKEADQKLLKENILVSVEKGKKNTTIDLSSYSIKFPENGLLVSIEWIPIEKNIGRSMKIKFEDTKRKFESVEPSFRTVKRNESEISWNYSENNWKRNDYNQKYYIERSSYKLAVEITLTD